MNKSTLCRRLARQLQSRVELEKSLGAELQSITLPPPPAKLVNPPTIKTAGPKKSPQTAFKPAPETKIAPTRSSPISANELGLAAGIGLPPITDLPPVTDKAAEIAPLLRDALVCKKCHLCNSRQNVVFGEGSLDADLVFVGEAPGANEDRTGKPFVGRAGELLTAMIEKGMGLSRNSIYICNILKCRPPGNRDPEAGEVGCCTPYLHEQLRIIRPKLIICLGRVSGQILSGQRMSMKNLRGQFFNYRGIPLLPTYHPAYLLRQREREGRGNITDRNTWADLQKAMAFLSEGNG